METNQNPELRKCSCSACDFNSCLVKNLANLSSTNGCKTEILNEINKNSHEVEYLHNIELQKNNEKLDGARTDKLNENQDMENIIELLLKDEYKNNLKHEIDTNSLGKLYSSTTNESAQLENDSYKEFNNLETEIDETISSENNFGKLNQSTAKLSAQIMDLPYQEFKDSICLRKTEPLPKTVIPKTSPFDIFKKIKDVYKACSCKVCECITGKSWQNGVCKCRPCECEDCKTFMKQVTISGHALELFQSGVVCSMFEKDLCRERIKSRLKEECNCQPCECVQCVESIDVPCACKPCQCIECKPLELRKHQKLIVATVEHNNQFHQECQCSPCNCSECTQRFGTTSNSMRREMSTGVNRHLQCRCETCQNEACLPDSNETCSCERRDKVMRKPVQQDNNDYDIRRAVITRNMKQRAKDKHDVIAMYAAISNKYPNYRSQETECSCSPCECLYCNHKEDSPYRSKIRGDTCKYSLINFKINTNKTSPEPCDCSKCDCLKCEKLCPPLKSYQAIKTFSKKNPKAKRCKCNLTGDMCNCINCKCENCCFDDVIYPIKKGETLTPAIYKNKINQSLSTFLNEKDEENQTEIPPKNSRLLLSGHKECKFPRYLSVDDYNQNTLQKANTKFKKAKYGQDINISQPSRNVINNFTKQVASNLQASFSNGSDNSSISGFKNSESIIKIGNKNKSQRSSCNSSGHDNSDFLIQFPSKVTKDYFSNIIKFNSETNSVNQIYDVPLKQYLFDKNLNISPNLHDRNMKDLYERNIPQKYKNDEQSTNKLSYDECSLVRLNSFNAKQTNVSNQCYIKYQENSNLTCNTTQTDNWVTKMDNEYKWFHNFSHRLEDAGRDIGDNKEITEKYQTFTHLTTPKHFDFDQDYKSVQKTLKEAQEFTVQLVHMLEKYENANKNFESITNKLKQFNKMHMEQNTIIIPKSLSHISRRIWISESNIIHTTEKDSVVTVPTKDENTKSESLNCVQNNIDDADFHVKSVQFSRNLISEEYSMPSYKNICNRKEINSCEAILDLKQYASEKLSCSSYESDNFDAKLINDSLTCESNLNPIVEEKENEKKRNVKKKNLKRYNKMYKRAAIATKLSKKFSPKTRKCSITTETSNAFINFVSEYDTKHIKTISPDVNKELKLKISTTLQDNTAMGDNSSAALFKAYKIKSEEQSKCKLHRVSRNKSIVMIKPPAVTEPVKLVGETKPKLSSILKKNLSTTGECDSRLKVSSKKSYEKAIRESVSAIKKASTSWQAKHERVNPDARSENKTLLKLYSEVKKLLELPILQKYESPIHDKGSKCNTSKITFKLEPDISYWNKIETKTEGCDKLKVNFISVDKISDDTIMVKWNAPKTLKNVQGYELLVNGQIVEKIFNVSRCTALVCGLPKANKILLTVRTIMISLCASSVIPSTTVVYRPIQGKTI